MKNFPQFMYRTLIFGALIFLLGAQTSFAASKSKDCPTCRLLNDYGNSCFKKGNIKDALHELKKCLLISPTYQPCRESLDRIFAQLDASLIKPRGVCPGEETVFDVSTTYGKYIPDPVCIWVFGDGSAAVEGLTVRKIFSAPGEYTVRLDIYDSPTQHVLLHSVLIPVTVYGNLAVDAGNDVRITDCRACPAKIDFCAKTTGGSAGCTKFVWDFGDGAQGEGNKITHVYNKSGRYTAKVTATDACSSASDSLIVDIAACKPPVIIPVKPKPIPVCKKKPVAPAPVACAPSKKKEPPAVKESTPCKKKQPAVKECKPCKKKPEPVCSAKPVVKAPAVNRSPQAALVNPASGCVCTDILFDASSSSDPDKNHLKYIWDFGDGTVIEGKAQQSHRYTKPALYKVTLTVDDGCNSPSSTDTASVTVSIKGPPVPAIASKDLICVGEDAEFDATASRFTGDYKAVYYWDFGDGTVGRGEKTKHHYKAPGIYTVRLGIEENAGLGCDSADIVKKVTVYPIFSVKSAEKEVRLCFGAKEEYKVKFGFAPTSTSAGRDLSYSWDFGDGTVSAGLVASHVYKEAGKYKATLTVDDGLNLACSKSTATVSLWLNRPPIAAANADEACCTDQSITFDGSKSTEPDGQSLSYKWEFGDGTTATDAVAQHAYKKGGEYTVKFTVDDNTDTACSNCQATVDVKVNDKPVPAIKIKECDSK